MPCAAAETSRRRSPRRAGGWPRPASGSGPFGDRGRFVDPRVGVPAADRSRVPTGHERSPTTRRARGHYALFVGDVDQLLEPDGGASMARAACTSTRGSPERTNSGCGSAGGIPAVAAVDQQSDTCSERDLADEVLDIDATERSVRRPGRARRSQWRRRRTPSRPWTSAITLISSSCSWQRVGSTTR